jgi:hypothetical protein
VVTANAANGATSIPIYPALIGPNLVTGGASQYQTVAALPANAAAISLVNTASEQYRKNFGFAKGAITMATADLVMPKKVEEVARAEMDGLSMRMLTDYIIGTDELGTRLDIFSVIFFIRPSGRAAGRRLRTLGRSGPTPFIRFGSSASRVGRYAQNGRPALRRSSPGLATDPARRTCFAGCAPSPMAQTTSNGSPP